MIKAMYEEELLRRMVFHGKKHMNAFPKGGLTKERKGLLAGKQVSGINNGQGCGSRWRWKSSITLGKRGGRFLENSLTEEREGPRDRSFWNKRHIGSRKSLERE
jgi:hypothetical protein